MAGVYEAPAFFLTTNLPTVCNLTPPAFPFAM